MTTKVETSTGTIKIIERLHNSTNGNPRFTITWETVDGEWRATRTQSDAAWGYEVGNPGFRVGDLVTFELTRSGRIAYGTVAA